MISKQFFHTLQARVKQAEQATDAELVTVLAPPAAAIATYPPCGRRCWPCSPRCWYSSSVSGSAGTDPAGAVVGLAGAEHPVPLDPIKMYLIPKQVRQHRAALMARLQFVEQGLHRTQDRLGC